MLYPRLFQIIHLRSQLPHPPPPVSTTLPNTASPTVCLPGATSSKEIAAETEGGQGGRWDPTENISLCSLKTETKTSLSFFHYYYYFSQVITTQCSLQDENPVMHLLHRTPSAPPYKYPPKCPSPLHPTPYPMDFCFWWKAPKGPHLADCIY